MGWLKQRWQEKSTKTALAGLIPIIFQLCGASVDVTQAAGVLATAALVGSAATNG